MTQPAGWLRPRCAVPKSATCPEPACSGLRGCGGLEGAGTQKSRAGEEGGSVRVLQRDDGLQGLTSSRLSSCPTGGHLAASVSWSNPCGGSAGTDQGRAP